MSGQERLGCKQSLTGASQGKKFAQKPLAAVGHLKHPLEKKEASTLLKEHVCPNAPLPQGPSSPQLGPVYPDGTKREEPQEGAMWLSQAPTLPVSLPRPHRTAAGILRTSETPRVDSQDGTLRVARPSFWHPGFLGHGNPQCCQGWEPTGKCSFFPKPTSRLVDFTLCTVLTKSEGVAALLGLRVTERERPSAAAPSHG